MVLIDSLLLICVALVNDAFNSTEKEGKIAYWKVLSEVIAGGFPILLRGGGNCIQLTVFPENISSETEKKKKD